MDYWGGVITIAFFSWPALLVIAVYSVLSNTIGATIVGGGIVLALALALASLSIVGSAFAADTIVFTIAFLAPIFIVKLILAIGRKRHNETQDVHWFLMLMIGQAGPLFWLFELTNL